MSEVTRNKVNEKTRGGACDKTVEGASENEG